MTNTIIYLIGHPGVGKYTIAQEISALTGARIVDNQSINNLIFSVVDSPLPKGVWHRIAHVRRAVFETVATLSPPDWSFVLTNALTNSPMSLEVFHSVHVLAEDRNATFIPVRLLCDTQEHINRITRPERAKQMKDRNPEAARKRSSDEPYNPSHPNTLTLNTTDLTAKGAALHVIRHIEELKKRTPE